jgi:hypothetical protein
MLITWTNSDAVKFNSRLLKKTDYSNDCYACVFCLSSNKYFLYIFQLRVIEYGANKYGFQPAGEGITVAPPTLVDESTRDRPPKAQVSYTSCWLYVSFTYIPLTLYPRRGSRGVLDIPPRRPRFTKIA